MPRHIHNWKTLKAARKELRNDGTASEAALWSCLKNSQLAGRKFRRQHSIEHFIVDFYCPAEKLIVEVDGEGHLTLSGQASDEHRDRYLRGLGFVILRYENKDIYWHLESVLEDIQSHFRVRI